MSDAQPALHLRTQDEPRSGPHRLPDPGHTATLWRLLGQPIYLCTATQPDQPYFWSPELQRWIPAPPAPH